MSMTLSKLAALLAGCVLLGGTIGWLTGREAARHPGASERGSIEAQARAPLPARDLVEIPVSEEWEERGRVLRPGSSGAWDYRFHGMMNPGAVIKKDGALFLYYIGADGDRSTDGGPRHRALGVATSRDGIHFEKYPGNPIVEFRPNGNEEEGIFSVAAHLSDDGTVRLYVGAMDAASPTSRSVDGDVMLAIGQDGFNFEVAGDVLDHTDEQVWGHGDELFPLGVIRISDASWLYYTAKEKGAKKKGRDGIYWDLGVATGPDPRRLSDTRPALEMEPFVGGGGAPVQINDTTLALFLAVIEERDWQNARIEVRLAPLAHPDRVGPAVATYAFPGLQQATVYLDRDSARWFLYYYDGGVDAIRVKTAPRLR